MLLNLYVVISKKKLYVLNVPVTENKMSVSRISGIDIEVV